jgi:hypothetical protein
MVIGMVPKTKFRKLLQKNFVLPRGRNQLNNLSNLPELLRQTIFTPAFWLGLLCTITLPFLFGPAARAAKLRPTAASAQAFKFTAANGASRDLFGSAVAISGDTALIGAYGSEANDNADQGVVYIFVRAGMTWSLQQQLSAPDATANDNFGWSVALSGDTALIGAINNGTTNTRQGAAYVFTRTGTVWTLQQKLTATDGAANDNFGWSVALLSNTALIGAHCTVGANRRQGAAYVFTRTGTTWAQQQKLTASDGTAQAAFGSAVALAGNTALIGAPDDDHSNQTLRGSAYVFTRTGTTWTQQQKLSANDGAPLNNFGFAVALSNETALIGAPNSNQNRGASYVFTRTSTVWTQEQKLVAGDGAASDGFGTSVTLSELNGNRALIGAPGNNSTRGAAYVFTRGGTAWTQLQKHTASDGAINDGFGHTLAESNNTVLIGGPGCTLNNQTEQGAAYTFELCPALSVGPATLPFTTVGSPVSQMLTANGGAAPYSFSLTSGALPDGVTLTATGLMAGTPSRAGSFSFSVRAQDVNGCTGLGIWTITLTCNALTLMPGTLPEGMTGTLYNQSLSSSGGMAPYNFSLSAGSLSSGLNLATNGIISGTPMLAGTFNFTVSTTDAFSCGGTRPFNLVIACPTITLSQPVLPQGQVNRPYPATTFTAMGGNGSYTFSVSAGALPIGMTINNGMLEGIPKQGGVFNFTVKATDATGCAATSNQSLTIRRLAEADFDGDGRSDLSVWRGSNGHWLTLNSTDNALQTQPWGAGYAPYFDVPVPGDYDGDGKTDHAIWRGGDSIWYIRKSSDGQAILQLWGANYAPYFDVPVPGDYDGDGKTDLAVWRPTTGNWYILKSSDGGYRVETWGSPDDKPVPGDYDGDGTTDLAYWRPSVGVWFIKNSSGGTQTIAWGAGYAPYFDVPVVADYDGDGKADLAIWRGQDSIWYIYQSSNRRALLQYWGANYAPYNDVPAPGDFDGDGKADIAVWRPTNATWYVMRSTDGSFMVQQHGHTGDLPIPAR